MIDLHKYGVVVPEVLLPKDVDLQRWAVVACDQYTQDRGYWQRVSAVVGDAPSTLNLIFPEVYLGDDGADARIAAIQSTMRRYLDAGVFAPAEKACIYVERTTAYGRLRKGLVLAVDLDAYDWKAGSKALIRATEATVPERIPPRMKIRHGAPLELPHIMLLVDDPDDALVGGTGALVRATAPVYDGDLQQESGHVTGWAVHGDEMLAGMERALAAIAQKGTDSDGTVFLFAVGDGNHSLATAKAVWEAHKHALMASGATPAALTENPVRYALVEVVNLYDTGLTFEPIHRAVFGADAAALQNFLAEQLDGSWHDCADAAALEAAVGGVSADAGVSGACFGFISTINGTTRYRLLRTAITDLAVSRLQPALDEFMQVHGGVSIDYIHGAAETVRLGETEGQLGILLPPIAKERFFATISARGTLPRKSFSMGEASEKRFYVEARRLF